MAKEQWCIALLFVALLLSGVADADVLQFKQQTPGNGAAFDFCSPRNLRLDTRTRDRALFNLSKQCDLFQGEWIPNPADPPYSETCQFIRNKQNCIENGRPDRGYLHLRWKPYGCDLPPFDPEIFLNLMENKSFAFIGDSISRNQKESLMCLLSKVEEPVPVYMDKSTSTSTWCFPSYNFTLAMMWSPFLLQLASPFRPAQPTPPQLHLDILDSLWTGRYQEFDYVLIGVGAWFGVIRDKYQNSTKIEEVGELAMKYVFRRATELTFRFVTSSEHKPFVIYRIHSPAHFEHGRYDKGGYCSRTLPFEEGEFGGYKQDQILVDIGREEFAKAVGSGGAKNGVRTEMLDVYHLSLLRPDGHPNNYSGTGDNKHDCVHWCMPGAVDTWNDLMMQMVLKDEYRRQSS